MTEYDLTKFLDKVKELNLLVKYIEKYPEKRAKLSECKSHYEVIQLTSSWGFEISKRWGEY
tara:strand:- start:734 stop:916 length:183 start_codon:yes stop_codon:yes gene_type:complete